MNKYFIYCRKSSEESSRQIQSLGTQQRILTEIASKEKLHVVDIITESRSARTDHNRPKFTEMLERIRNGKANGILTVNVDRIARNYIEAGYITKLVEQEILKEIKTQEITYKNDRTFTYLLQDFARATSYSKELSIKVKEGNKSKILRGEFPGPAPIGYVNIRPGKGIKPDPIRAPFITKAFLLYSLGDQSLSTLKDQLSKEGFRTKYGKEICISSLHRLLTNPEYYGLIRRKGELSEGSHEPLTTKIIFDEVQKIMDDKVKRKKEKKEFLYRGFLTCNVCNCNITATLAKNKYPYYYCTNGKGACDQHKKYCNEDHIEKEFEKLLSEFTLNPELANKSFEIYKDKILENKDYKKNSSDAIDNQIISLEKRSDKLLDMCISDRINQDEFDNKKTDINNELTQLKTIKKQQNYQKDEITLELVEMFKNNAIQLDFMFKNGDEQVKKDLLRSLLWNADLKDGKIVSTRLKRLWEPLRNLNNSQDLPTWWAIQDSNL